MKSIKLLFFALLLSASVFAQPTITTAELPIAGLAWTTANDSAYFTPVLPGGANVTWDYSGLLNSYIDTVGFRASAGTPYASSFPTSNLAAYDPASGAWTYVTTNSTGLYFDGFTEPTFGTLNFSTPQLVVPVPFSFGSTRTNNSGFTVDTNLNGTNIRFEIAIQSQFEGDGYGTVILPTGNYNNVLRVKTTTLSTNTISTELVPGTGIYIPVSTSQSQSTTFSHYQEGATASFILDIDADSLGLTTNSSSYLLQSVVLSTPELSESREATVYPNPASNSLLIEGVGFEKSITVYGIDGKIVSLSVTPSGVDGRVDVSNLSNGLYFFTAGKRAGKFTVQH